MRTFYRIVRSNPPKVADFLSNVELRRPLPRDPETARLWSGISVYETERQARRRAGGVPGLGDHLAELHVDEGPLLRVERTTRSRGTPHALGRSRSAAGKRGSRRADRCSMMEGAHLIYELWDVESGNLVSAYEMESDALAWVREAVDLHGHPFADALALVRDDDQAEVETIAVGAALVARARSMVAMADRL